MGLKVLGHFFKLSFFLSKLNKEKDFFFGIALLCCSKVNRDQIRVSSSQNHFSSQLQAVKITRARNCKQVNGTHILIIYHASHMAMMIRLDVPMTDHGYIRHGSLCT